MTPKKAVYILFLLLTFLHCNRAGANVDDRPTYPQIDWTALAISKPWLATEDWRPVPPATISSKNRDSLNKPAPENAIVLFEGSSLKHWQTAQLPLPANQAQVRYNTQHLRPDFVGKQAPWKVINNVLAIEPGAGSIATKQSFGDIHLHIEWRLSDSTHHNDPQWRGNSGVAFMSLYELQILDSAVVETYSNGIAGAIYKQFPPMSNAALPAGHWQSYDVDFTAPIFANSGDLISPAKITVWHNGQLIHYQVALLGPTAYIGQANYHAHQGKLPLLIQDHGSEVEFRNIWLIEK